MIITSTVLSSCLLAGLLASGIQDTAAKAFEPIPLAHDARGHYGSGEFLSTRSWTVLDPELLNGAVFIQPSRQDGLGERSGEWFDKAFLRLSPREGAQVGVSQPLQLQGTPLLAQAGVRYRIGVNLRGDDGSGQATVQLQDDQGRPIAVSEPIRPGEPRRHFIDLEIPSGVAADVPLQLAILGNATDSSSTGSFDVDQISIAEIVEDDKEFVSLFNGTDLSGWTGTLNGYGVEGGVIRTYPKRAGGNIYTEGAYDDFVFRFRFKVQPGSNNGIAIRAPLTGDAAYQGMEVQLLENSHAKYSGLKPWQFHGSIYGVAPSLRGYQRPPGEWNDQEIRADGRIVRVVLNGKVIMEVDLEEALKAGLPSGRDHPGIANTSGHIGFCGHGDLVGFTALRIRRLPVKKNENFTPVRR